MLKENIKKLKEKYGPKNYGTGIKKDPELLAAINRIKSKYPSLNSSAALYILENNFNPVCKNGNMKKWVDGFFGFCGHASKCECAKDSVSKSVSITKQQTTTEQNAEINKKREQTNLAVHGVSNTFQTEKAKDAHKEFYTNPLNIEQQMTNLRQTLMERYGEDNPLKIPEFLEKQQQTNLIKNGYSNPSHNPINKEKQSIRSKKQKEDGVYKLAGYNKFKKYLLDNFEWDLITALGQYQGVRQNGVQYNVKCVKCGHEHDLKINYGRLYKCKICYPTQPLFVSKEETEVFDFINKELGIVSYQSDKSIINPFELDIVCPEQKIAIEYCGLYWHSKNSSLKDNNYHYNKMKLCEKKGYRLITIFSDEWINQKDAVKNVLKHIFGKTDKVVYARKCVINIIMNNEEKDFLNKNHLIKFGNQSTISYGLYNSGNLVALMSFKRYKVTKKDFINNTIDGYYWRLERFVTDGCSVVGGASKLLKHFIKEQQPKLIVTFADARWSQGNIYRTLGFVEDVYEQPSYEYVEHYEIRHHKFNFRKAKLQKHFDFDVVEYTENELTNMLGYDRIYDCGKYRFKMVF
jgi:hypothetical protein